MNMCHNYFTHETAKTPEARQLALISTQTENRARTLQHSTTQKTQSSRLNLVLHSLTDFRSICCDKVIVKFHTSAKIPAFLRCAAACLCPATPTFLCHRPPSGFCRLSHILCSLNYTLKWSCFSSRARRPTPVRPSPRNPSRRTQRRPSLPSSSAYQLQPLPCPSDLTVWFCWHFI